MSLYGMVCSSMSLSQYVHGNGNDRGNLSFIQRQNRLDQLWKKNEENSEHRELVYLDIRDKETLPNMWL